MAVTLKEKDIEPTFENVQEHFPSHLMTEGLPDPDIMLRTSGEQRVSNFLLWQCAYTEFVYTDTLWPDFDEEEMHRTIDMFNKRERRYGAIEVK